MANQMGDAMAEGSSGGEASEPNGEMVSGGDEVDAPRDEAAAGSATNEERSAMAAASSGGEADELIDEVVAGSAANEKGDAVAPTKRGGVRKSKYQRRRERRKE